MKSINTFSLSGRLTSDARYFDGKNGKVARFTIPEALLKKGTPVLIAGYFRPNVNTKDGVKYENTDLVVTSCDPACRRGRERLIGFSLVWPLRGVLLGRPFLLFAYRHQNLQFIAVDCI